MLAITLIQFALPIVIVKAAVSTDITLKLNDDYSPKQFGFNFSMSGGSVFRPVAECVRHATDSNHGLAALPQDAKGQRRVVKRCQRSV